MRLDCRVPAGMRNGEKNDREHLPNLSYWDQEECSSAISLKKTADSIVR